MSHPGEGWQRRSDVGLLKELFFREEQLLAENNALAARHTLEVNELQSSLAAVRLSHCSLNDHLASTQHLVIDLQEAHQTLQDQYNQLTTRYYSLTSELRASQEELMTMKERSVELHHENQANLSLAERLRADLDGQSMELTAVEGAARQMGDVIREIVLTDDIAVSAFKGAVDVADLIIHSRYQEAEISNLKAALEQATGSNADTKIPSLCSSESTSPVTSAKSFIAFSKDDAKEPETMDNSSAYEMWEAYRQYRPLDDDDLP